MDDAVEQSAAVVAERRAAVRVRPPFVFRARVLFDNHTFQFDVQRSRAGK